MPSLETNFVHLGLGAAATVEPPFDGMEWYAAYSERHCGDGIEGRLVSQYSFSESWDSWEVHPSGAELVICTAGTLILHREQPNGEVETVTLGPGDYAINPAGVWHTADVPSGACATAIFITAGEGTRHRPR
jgi:mannose-6-phosphate isomerase-like protein (cupin superfamily)